MLRYLAGARLHVKMVPAFNRMHDKIIDASLHRLNIFRGLIRGVPSSHQQRWHIQCFQYCPNLRLSQLNG
jgi:hypothetical protein